MNQTSIGTSRIIGSGRFSRQDKWALFKVVKGGQGRIALWNPTHKRFLVMASTRTGRSRQVANGVIPKRWVFQGLLKFKVKYLGGKTIAFWNQSSQRFLRMNHQRVDGSGKHSFSQPLPVGWIRERFKVVVIR